MADEPRDKQSIGTSRSLAVVPLRVTYGQQVDGWFGAGTPMNPVAPPSVKGRIFDYPTAYNQSYRPRAYEAITFDQLRAFADSYDLMRVIIETRKDQMARQKWTLAPREFAKNKNLDTKIEEIKEFMVRPDKHHFWAEWLRMLLEDMFVIDAATIHRRRTNGGKLFALDLIDGGTIKRVLDDYARTPEPPLPAYQQVLKGMPAVQYTADELYYRPRNLRTHKAYGFSPVEQIIMTVNIALRRQVWQLQSFTEGNIPEALIGTPATWTPDQISAFQDYFDQILEGNMANRRKARFVPGEIAKGYMATKPDQIFQKDAEEWLARVVCFTFSISPQPFVHQMNRATAESAAEQAISDGLAPIMGWVKSLMDTIIIDDFDAPELEFMWEDEIELDPKTQSDILNNDAGSGIITLNDARREKGMDPYPDADADRPMVKTATGYVFIFPTEEEKAAKEALALAAATPPPGQGGDGEDDPSPGADGPPATPPASKDDKEVVKKDAAPFPVTCCGSAERDGPRLSKAKSKKRYVDPDRDEVKPALKRMRTKLAAALKALGADVAKQVKTKIAAMRKADDPDMDDEIKRLLDSLDIEFDVDIVSELEDVYRLGGAAALAQMGTKLADDLVEQVNERAVEWAAEYAGELISDIEDSTLDMIRETISSGLADNLSTADISDNLEELYAFSEDRADLIAYTEVASANSNASLDSYKDAEDTGLTVRKSWLILDDACDICQENEDAGAIDLDEQFPSGDDAPPGHPNCRCVLVPETEDDEGNVEEGEEEDSGEG